MWWGQNYFPERTWRGILISLSLTLLLLSCFTDSGFPFFVLVLILLLIEVGKMLSQTITDTRDLSMTSEQQLRNVRREMQETCLRRNPELGNQIKSKTSTLTKKEERRQRQRQRQRQRPRPVSAETGKKKRIESNDSNNGKTIVAVKEEIEKGGNNNNNTVPPSTQNQEHSKINDTDTAGTAYEQSFAENEPRRLPEDSKFLMDPDCHSLCFKNPNLKTKDNPYGNPNILNYQKAVSKGLPMQSRWDPMAVQTQIDGYSDRIFQSLSKGLEDRFYYTVPDPTTMATQVWFPESDGLGPEDSYTNYTRESFNTMVFPFSSDYASIANRVPT